MNIEIIIRNQWIYEKTRGSSRLNADPYCLFLTQLITSCMKRKKELSCKLSYQNPEDVAKLFLNPNAPNCVIFLNRDLANSLVVAFRKNNVCVQLPIYRVLYGYSTRCSEFEIPSLKDYCLWNLASSSKLSEVNEASLQKRAQKVKNLNVLWGIHHIPLARPSLENVYDTLSSILTNFNTVLKASGTYKTYPISRNV